MSSKQQLRQTRLLLDVFKMTDVNLKQLSVDRRHHLLTSSASLHTDSKLQESHKMVTPASHPRKASSLASGKPHRDYHVLVPITKFTLFPKLPLELRRLIWKFALFTPQILIIDSVKVGPFRIFTTLDKQSSLRQVNKEARAEALQIETLTYAKDINLGVSGTYLNPNVDIFWVLHGSLNHGFVYCLGDISSINQRLRRIALSAKEWFSSQMLGGTYKTRFSRFLTDKGVEEIFIIVSSRNRMNAARSLTNKAFTVPRKPPHLTLDPNEQRYMSSIPGLEAICGRQLTWTTVEECMTKSCREFQELCHEERMNHKIGDSDGEGRDADSEAEAIARVDGSLGVTIKRIKFVEIWDAGKVDNSRTPLVAL